MTDKEHAAGLVNSATGVGVATGAEACGAPPLDYPTIPEDLRRQIREERREIIDILCRVSSAIEDGRLIQIGSILDLHIRAILAREGGKS